MRLNRLTKLSQLMKEAKEQYFNLYNDMKDSIYVEQKGRTVGDVEVLPGKTLSGCITSSDINVHYTNLMGGKDSKIISSSELMALIPSLTTKNGELSPTLNISKALINISIQKYNSANKLAELKKIATNEASSSGQYQQTPNVLGQNPTFALSGNLARNKQFNDLAKYVYDKYSYNDAPGLLDRNKNIELFVHDMNMEKDGDTKKWDQLQGGPINADGDFFKHYAIPYADKLVEQVKENIKNSKSSPENASKTNSGAKAQPQATRGPAKAKTPITLAKGDTVSDDWGKYTGIDRYSFSFKGNNGQEGIYSSSKSGWEQSAAKINALVTEKSKSTATTPAAQTQTPAATTPAAGEAAKTQQTGRQFNPTTIANVVAILQRAAKPGGMGLAAGSWTKDERGRIQKIISTINTVNNRVDAYDLLAKILIVTSGAESSFNGALGGDNYVKQIATADRRDVVADRKGKGTFNKQVAFVLDYMNEFYDGEFADDNAGTIKKFLKDFSSGEQPAETPAATHAAPAANAGQQPAASAPVTPPATKPEAAPATNAPAAAVKSASRVDPRIKKLATLRRLRVRSQMEAATESSAQFGRSRVS